MKTFGSFSPIQDRTPVPWLVSIYMSGLGSQTKSWVPIMLIFLMLGMTSALQKPPSMMAMVMPCPRNPSACRLSPPITLIWRKPFPYGLSATLSLAVKVVAYFLRSRRGASSSGCVHTRRVPVTNFRLLIRSITVVSVTRTSTVLSHRLPPITGASFLIFLTYLGLTGRSVSSRLSICFWRRSKAFFESSLSGLERPSAPSLSFR